MQTFRQNSSSSRFTPIAALARCVANAPANSQGQPCVYACVAHDAQGKPCLVAKTLDERHDAQLVLADTDPTLIRSSFDYLVERLKSIGLAVVASEAQLARA